ncbi:MAG: hypothetical protein HC829_03990 [Bacteroidales bacterium]|nr:hypothetical protein [Bacteroidales bacterium]
MKLSALVVSAALARRFTQTRPDVFVGMAEETGHIRALTDYVLDQAIADWLERHNVHSQREAEEHLESRIWQVHAPAPPSHGHRGADERPEKTRLKMARAKERDRAHARH